MPFSVWHADGCGLFQEEGKKKEYWIAIFKANCPSFSCQQEKEVGTEF